MVKVWVSLKTTVQILGYGIFRLSSPNFMNLVVQAEHTHILGSIGVGYTKVSVQSRKDEDVLTAAIALNHWSSCESRDAAQPITGGQNRSADHLSSAESTDPRTACIKRQILLYRVP